MSTQYNQIQAPYDLIRHSTIALLERENIRTTIQPLIKDARILDLACGSGHYTYPFLSWGAASVVGVDISTGMLDAARRACPGDVTMLESEEPPESPSSASATQKESENGKRKRKSKTVTFIEADIAHPRVFGRGGYDIVFGAWLLNYASHRDALTRFYTTIALNLRDKGTFLSITVPPVSNPRHAIAAELALRPRSGGLMYEALDDVDEGVLFRVHGESAVGDVEFRCWWLEQKVYEECARAGGLRGELTWGKTDPGGWLEEGVWEGGARREELESYAVRPHYGVLMVGK